MSSPVVALEQGLSLLLADWLMREKHIRHLPVLDSERRVVGLVTHRTILAARYAELDDGAVLPVADIMVPNPMTIGADETAADAARFLVENRIGCALIVDQDDHAQGIITESDFVELAARLLLRAPRISVDDFMTTDVVTLSEGEPIVIADALMRQGRFRHLPVVDADGRLTGIVTHRDLIAAHLSGEERQVNEIASRDVWSVGAGSAAGTAARTLADHRFGCLPVTEDGKLVGLITEADILALLVRLLTRRGAFVTRVAPLRLYMSSPVHCIGLDATLDQARREMSRRGISALAVLSSIDSIVGVITSTDLDPTAAALAEGTVVGDVMSRDVICVDVETSLHEAAQELVDDRIHRLFVLEEGRVAGVISTTDFVYAVRDLRVHTPLAEIMSPLVMTIGVGEDLAAAVQFLDTARLRALVVTEHGRPVGVLSRRGLLERPWTANARVVEDLMTSRVLCLDARLPAFRAAAQMAELGVDHVVVAEEGCLVGVVTSFDMARLCAMTRPADQADQSVTHRRKESVDELR